MAELGPEKPPPAADLEAAIAALPAKKEALREAFNRLTACSPYPLPFTWEGLDAHISTIQSSISRRLRQLQVLEAARPARAIAAPTENRSGENQQDEEEEEDEVEVEVEEEEVKEEKESDDEEDKEGEGVEQGERKEVEEEEVEEEEEEEEEVEEEVVGEAEQEADNEMQLTNEEDQNVKEVTQACRKVEEQEVVEEVEQEANKEVKLFSEEDQNAKEEPQASEKVEEQNADKEMVRKKGKEPEEETSEEVHQQGKVEQEVEEEEEAPYMEPGVKNADVSLKEDINQEQVQRPQGTRSKNLMVVCARKDANMLVKLIHCNRTAFGKDLQIAMRHAPDAPALVLRVVKLFLSSKDFKSTKAWNKCISLIRCVPAATSKPSPGTIEQAKHVGKDWKEMIYKLECPPGLEFLDAWGLLYFLISYNIVSEFDTSEIILLFSMVPRHKQNKNTIELCKGLRITNRITDLIDYLIGKGKQLEVFHLAYVFNLSDKYPLVSLLKGYIETAKQTAMEIRSKSLSSAITKEVENLWAAHNLAKQRITDSSQRDDIMVEIQTLLDGYAKKKKRLAKECTSNLQAQQKKQKKEEHELYKGQESLQQDQQSNAQVQEHQQNNPQQKQQKQENQTPVNLRQQQKNKPQAVQKQLLKRPRTTNLRAPAVPQIAHFWRSPYSDLPGVRDAPIFALPPGEAQYMQPFNPFYPHSQFYGPW